jgi:hypothetical protein
MRISTRNSAFNFGVSALDLGNQLFIFVQLSF